MQALNSSDEGSGELSSSQSIGRTYDLESLLPLALALALQHSCAKSPSVTSAATAQDSSAFGSFVSLARSLLSRALGSLRILSESGHSGRSRADAALFVEFLRVSGDCELSQHPSLPEVAEARTFAAAIDAGGGVDAPSGTFSIPYTYIFLRLIELEAFGCSPGWWAGPKVLLGQ
jgi:hypothetical protein